MSNDLKEILEQGCIFSLPAPNPFRSPTDKDFKEIEESLNIVLDEEMKDFLTASGKLLVPPLEPAVAVKEGGYLFIGEIAKNAWEAGVPERYIAFCEDNGDFYCLEKNSRKVLFWDHNGSSNEQWDNLAHWVKEVWFQKK